MAVNQFLIIQLISLAIFVPLSALVLMWSTKMFKLNDTSYKTAIIVAAVVGGVGALVTILMKTPAWYVQLLIGAATGIVMVKQFYKIEWNKTFTVWIVWFLLNLVLSMIVGFVVGLITAAVFLGSAVTAFA